MSENITSNNRVRRPAVPEVLDDPLCNRGVAAVAVARAAADDGVASEKHDNLVQAGQDAIWQPAYPDSVS